MSKEPEHAGEPWTPEQEKELRELTKSNTPTRLIAHKLGRSVDAIYSKASDMDLSLQPTNQSPYGPRRTGSQGKKNTGGSGRGGSRRK